jgi:hypothetical protein
LNGIFPVTAHDHFPRAVPHPLPEAHPVA